VGRAVAASTRRSFNACACPRKDFRGVFFLRKFSRNSVSFNVPQLCVQRGAATSAAGFAAAIAPQEKLHPAARKIALRTLPSVCRKTRRAS
jgi:hypothetical protein